MGVGVYQHICRSMSGSSLNSFYIAAGDHQLVGGTGMPLRYNYDKPEKPRRIKSFEVFSLVFSSFSKPKNHTEISRKLLDQAVQPGKVSLELVVLFFRQIDIAIFSND